ncbi:MAG TPA: cobalamin-dependent protein [Gemmatimonadales bacterium]|nr:cobalamin-dependent protein [Gemmatimonadales bacterium]
MPTDPSEPRHPVRLAAQRSGVTPHVLRAWERRYQVVTPVRSEGGQRLYSDRDVGRLRLLRRLTGRGHSISQLAKLPNDDLERILREEEPAAEAPPTTEGRAVEFRSAAVQAAQRLDASGLHALLERAVVSLGVPAFLDEVAVPSIREIGHGWENGTVTVGQEHLATVVFRRILGWIIDTVEAGEQAARLLVATPPGQVHELGALLAGAAAASEGWDVVYLGADLPPAEVLRAAEQADVQAVALSIVLPTGDAALMRNLMEIREGLPANVPLFLGGAAVDQDPDRFRKLGARIIDSLIAFRASLQDLLQLRT